MKDKIQDLLQMCERNNNLPFNRERYNAFWKSVGDLDKSVGDGLVPGRLVKWQVADGYACYIVVKVGKTLTQLQHLPEGDGYTFAGTFINSRGNVVVPTVVAQQAIQWHDGLRKLFASK